MTLQEKLKLALGEMMLQQITLADTVEQLQTKIAEMTKAAETPKPEEETKPE